MKDFVKMALAVICGIFIMNIITFIMILGMAGSMVTLGKQTASLPGEGILFIDMSKIIISDQASDNPLSFSGSPSDHSSISLWDAVQAINTAAEDPAVEFIYIKPDGHSLGMSTMEEFGKSLDNFRKSGKAIIARIEAPGTGSYFLASSADKIYMPDDEGVTHMFHGISSQMIFLKDILDKLGVNVQLIRHGKYKSAGEMFTKNVPSSENMEQNQVLIDSIWDNIGNKIAENRNISRGQLDDIINFLKLTFPEDWVNAGLVDELMDRETFHRKLADLAVKEKYDDVKFIKFEDYVKAKIIPNLKAKNKIAVIYAEGNIIDGTDRKQVAGTRFANEIAKVRADSTIKAVVFRVNSPGGSVAASEKIKKEIDLLKKDKPVIASYGDYAASGGYWISAGCDKIYTDASTLTGSIGVFSMIPDFSKTIKDFAKINIVSVNSHKHSDVLSLMRPLDKDEYAYMQASVERIYDKFVSVVSEGRKLEPSYVDGIAQGRVWSGSDAVKIGLADETGTLEDAVLYAISTVAQEGVSTNIKDWRIESFPKPLSTMEQLMELFGGSSAKADVVRNIFASTPLEDVADAAADWTGTLTENPTDVMFARLPYEITIK